MPPPPPPPPNGFGRAAAAAGAAVIQKLIQEKLYLQKVSYQQELGQELVLVQVLLAYPMLFRYFSRYNNKTKEKFNKEFVHTNFG